MVRYKMSLSQTTLFSHDDVLVGTIRELASNSKVLGFIEGVMNNCPPAYPYLLLIPETRRKPFTRSQLYKKVKGFLREQGLDAEYHVVFISNVLGVCPEELSGEEVSNFELIGSIPDNSVIRRTANILADYLEKTRDSYTKRMVYARGSYLETVKMASENSSVNIESILTESDLVWLKRMGIKWMKIGLKMPECFSIFK
ncbi:MAG: DUF5591 domain-containing protein, partial [Candidatus Thermoplasmatota archaeon]|nr:DUF5591 domain-containing protein [Candidatus Thermoplasmatota archaeon]